MVILSSLLRQYSKLSIYVHVVAKEGRVELNLGFYQIGQKET